jgi:hypothetical protein
LRDTVVGEEPYAQGDEACEHCNDDGREEERLEDRGDGVDGALWDKRGLELERQHRIRLLDLGVGAVGAGDHPERAQALVDQLPDVVGADAALDRLAHRGGDLLVRPLPVGGLGDQVEKWRELDDLPVGATRDVGRFLEARALVLAD